MTPEPPAPTPRLKRRYLRWLGVLLLGYFAYAGWKAYDYRAAVKEAEALGWTITNTSPFDDIKKHWRAAFRGETWTQIQRNLEINGPKGFTGHESLLLRLNPQALAIFHCHDPLNFSTLKHLPDLRILMIEDAAAMTDENMDEIQELTNLIGLYFGNCPRLTHLNPFIGLKKLEGLRLWDNPPIPQKDIKAFEAAHPDTIVEILP